MVNKFLERLDQGLILGDGAMGTLLYERGISYEHSFDEQNLSHSKIVLNVHLDYIKAGAEIIETNTFGSNQIRLAKFGLENKVKEINQAGAKIARQAREIAGKDVFVAGSMGPLGKPLEPLGKISETEAFEFFKEQAEGLLEGGVDLFIVETMTNLKEIKIAISAIKKICELPIIAEMTFAEDGLTFMGNSPEEVAEELSQLKVDVIGANCSVGPQKMLDVISTLARKTKCKLSAMPNAGLPGWVDGRFIYLSSPDYFTEYALKFIQAGATIVGGCCGTTPEHIKAIHKALKSFQNTQGNSLIYFPAEIEEIEEKKETKKSKEISTFAEKLKRKFVISVELDPPRGTNPEKLLKGAELLYKNGVDAVNIADSPMARVRMSCLPLAVLIKEKTNLDLILHFTCRDRNLMGLQADLIGAHALGIKNILALTGDPPSLGDYPQATAVYDIDSIGLVKVISQLNQGEDWIGNSIGEPTSFFTGVAVNPTLKDYAKEMRRFEKKIEAGALFAFTQPLYDMKVIENFKKDTESYNIPIILGILPLYSFRHAEFLHNEVPGIIIPEKIRQRMKKVEEKGASEGVKIARELLLQSKSMFSGIYLMPSFGKYELILEVIEGII
jgi:methionine synthase I (cobalamin-dependent)/5,10-methylenetetrahydrofolate reductase